MAAERRAQPTGTTGTGLAGLLTFRRSQLEVLVPFGILAAVMILVIPLPTALIDLFIICSLISGVVIIMTTMYVNKPLEFSIFPSVILFTTLFRLFLSVATTRSILNNAAAGHVIETFATFVTGGSPIIGLVIFAIIIIINFVVITYGAQRIGEVAARFTLDALPGKQISIDADLNAGIINEEQARTRRRQLEREADYFGAMDGASRFVQRDALAGIILIFVNIGAGFLVGMLSKGMSAGEAFARFSALTVGDGLVTSIPALLISTATGVMVTKAASEETVGMAVISQLTSQWRALAISAVFILLLGLVPGMPKIFMFSAAALLGWLAWTQYREQELPGAAGLPQTSAAMAAAAEAGTGPQEKQLTPEEKAKQNLEALLHVDLLELEIGYGLIPLVSTDQGGDLLERVNNIRKQVALSLGFLVPPMRIRDNIVLKPGEYHIKIKGSVVAKGELLLDRYLAMNPASGEAKIEGIPTKEPAFNLEAYWITPTERTRAETLGFTVVDPPTVLATHLTEVIKNHAAELLSRQAVQELLDLTKQKFPAVVNELVPDRLSIGEVQRVLQLLLKEKVSVRNLPLLLETLADSAGVSRDPEVLAEYARIALGRQIISDYADEEGKLTVLTLDPRIEERVAGSLQTTTTGTIPVLPPDYLRGVVQNCTKGVQQMLAQGYSPVFLVSPRVRPYLRKMLEKVFPGLIMLSYGELVGDVEIKTFGMVPNPESG
jgi:flagellar biosynthesis protein FlhA